MPATPSTPFLPSYSFYECHTSGAIAAPPERIVDAVTQIDMRTDPVVDRLLRIREWPAGVFRKLGVARAASAAQPPFGIDTFTLLNKDRNAVSLGLVGRFWQFDFGLVTIADAEAFMSVNRPDVAKLVLRFEAQPCSADRYSLRTETFVYCPTWRTRVAMTPYWLAIRLASGWIRRRTLARVEQHFALER
ncbi:hypothetical protein [Paraburkholderia sp. J12]|uniref:hypothetical protein n=1 Tax=Paraburkholderia sp. J12 TaxID=2805432 RepID=UPI002ABD4401|nr:hypothetical protein [Paraburkholderia sp. J12]